MPQWTKETAEPSLYGWVNIADLRAALPAILEHLQAGGMAPITPGPGGLDADGLELPGEPIPWRHKNLTLNKLRRLFKRHTSETRQGHALIELEFKFWRRLPVKLRRKFGTVAEFKAHALTTEPHEAAGDELADFGEPLGPHERLD